MKLLHSSNARKLSCFLFLTASPFALSSFVEAMEPGTAGAVAEEEQHKQPAAAHQVSAPSTSTFDIEALAKKLQSTTSTLSVTEALKTHEKDIARLTPQLSASAESERTAASTTLSVIYNLSHQAYQRASGITDVEEGKTPRIKKEFHEARFQDHSQILAGVLTALSTPRLHTTENETLSRELGLIAQEAARYRDFYTARVSRLVEEHPAQFTKSWGFRTHYYYVKDNLVFLTDGPGAEEGRAFLRGIAVSLGRDTSSLNDIRISGPVILQQDRGLWGEDGRVKPALINPSDVTREFLRQTPIHGLLTQYHEYYFSGVPLDTVLVQSSDALGVQLSSAQRSAALGAKHRMDGTNDSVAHDTTVTDGSPTPLHATKGEAPTTVATSAVAVVHDDIDGAIDSHATIGGEGDSQRALGASDGGTPKQATPADTNVQVGTDEQTATNV